MAIKYRFSIWQWQMQNSSIHSNGKYKYTNTNPLALAKIFKLRSFFQGLRPSPSQHHCRYSYVGCHASRWQSACTKFGWVAKRWTCTNRRFSAKDQTETWKTSVSGIFRLREKYCKKRSWEFENEHNFRAEPTKIVIGKKVLELLSMIPKYEKEKEKDAEEWRSKLIELYALIQEHKKL